MKCPISFVFSYVLLSVTQQYRQRTAWKASLQSTQQLEKTRLWSVHPISWYVKAIMPQFQQYPICFITLYARNSMASGWAGLQLHRGIFTGLAECPWVSSRYSGHLKSPTYSGHLKSPDETWMKLHQNSLEHIVMKLIRHNGHASG